MRKFNPFKFKAIETRYDNYLFRSRLEARWAVFFNTLGIKYEYEKEGYDLEGTWYLPDFWLPEMNSWVEIKGQQPTEEERHKAKQLSFWTQKQVYIFAGNIGEETGYLEHPPLLYTSYHAKDGSNNHQYKKIETSPEVLNIVGKLHNVGIKARANHYDLQLWQDGFCRGRHDMQEFIQLTQRQHDTLIELIPYLEQYKQALMKTLIADDEWEIEYDDPITVNGVEWFECKHCGKFDISIEEMAHFDCHEDSQEGDLIKNTPRIMAAYTAAREARF